MVTVVRADTIEEFRVELIQLIEAMAERHTEHSRVAGSPTLRGIANVRASTVRDVKRAVQEVFIHPRTPYPMLRWAVGYMRFVHSGDMPTQESDDAVMAELTSDFESDQLLQTEHCIHGLGGGYVYVTNAEDYGSAIYFLLFRRSVIVDVVPAAVVAVIQAMRRVGEE